ncbi:hypothetical protein T440DRAFT_166240 [Plenodomus tracheiphilus IPT5]|uniref:Uncharacterized protein n=1 Tax=Plenodomus tracheiphilus IPT5 TaxID=1408161 RepID=A0A6A7AYY3_9PLEO|nr:hypothetical protein T440DRAFT_166240 [Plenodomus tracheiphilus IPT5]
MAQGAVKKSKPVAARKPSKSGPRPGARVIKPKKPSLIVQNKIKHKSSCGLVGQTEKLLAQKAGHLEILKGGGTFAYSWGLWIWAWSAVMVRWISSAEICLCWNPHGASV